MHCVAMDPAPWRWNHRTEPGDTLEGQTEKVLMKARQVLYKLMYQSSDSLSEGLLKLDLEEHNARIVNVAEIVLEMAISDTMAVSACAQMVRDVCRNTEDETAKTFLKEVLDRCNQRFQEMSINKDKIRKKVREIEEASHYEKEALKLDLEDFCKEMRERDAGNVRFMGELFKLGMLNIHIMVDSVETLLGNQDEESYESLCTLLTTAGEKLESSLKDVKRRARIAKLMGGPMPEFIPEDDYMEKTFKKLVSHANDQTLSFRVRSALLDLVELWDRKWFVRPGSNAQNIEKVRRGISTSYLGDQRRQSPMNINRYTQQRKVDWNTVPSTKSSRFSKFKKSCEVSNSPDIAPSDLSCRGLPPYNRPSSNGSNITLRLAQQQQLEQQQQQQNRFSRFSSSPGPGVRSTGSFSSPGINVTPGGEAAPSGFEELQTAFTLTKDPDAWRPNRLGWSSRKETIENSHDEKQTEGVVKQARGILNKLTLENFDELCDKFLNLDLDERLDRISAVSKVVFEKAINEPSFSAAYAQMVHHVCQHSQETAKKFRKEILDQCQKEFQKTSKDKDEIATKNKEIEKAPADKKETLKLNLQEFRIRMRRRSLGNVRFIGELFKLQMLTPKIMVDCVQMLLGKNTNRDEIIIANQDEESYECLCTLLTIVGQKLDNALKDVENRAREAKARGGPMPKFIPEDNYMDKTFKRLKALSSDQKLSFRIRFALLDLVELRDRRWSSWRSASAIDFAEED